MGLGKGFLQIRSYSEKGGGRRPAYRQAGTGDEGQEIQLTVNSN